MYYLSYDLNGKSIGKLYNSFDKAMIEYDKLYKDSQITNLSIKDMEYGIYFINYKWERDENLIGWCGTY